MNNSATLVRSDILAVTLSSLLIAVYLCVSLFTGEPESHAADLPPSPVAPEDVSRGDVNYAAWVQHHDPVPGEVLYPYSEDPTRQAPPPAHESKPQSWWNKMLFPATKCPYCGRRVPTKQGSYFWLLLGFIGQIGFTMRFFVQWMASEKARESVIPVSFWYLSIFGSVLLLAYSISILAWPIILGQTPNIFIYARNLYFIRKKQQAAG